MKRTLNLSLLTSLLILLSACSGTVKLDSNNTETEPKPAPPAEEEYDQDEIKAYELVKEYKDQQKEIARKYKSGAKTGVDYQVDFLKKFFQKLNKQNDAVREFFWARLWASDGYGPPVISPDGTKVAFSCKYSLENSDTNDVGDMYLWDLDFKEVRRISKSTFSDQDNCVSKFPTLTEMGTVGAFLVERHKYKTKKRIEYLPDLYVYSESEESLNPVLGKSKLPKVGKFTLSRSALEYNSPVLTSDGSRLFFSCRIENLQPKQYKTYIAVVSYRHENSKFEIHRKFSTSSIRSSVSSDGTTLVVLGKEKEITGDKSKSFSYRLFRIDLTDQELQIVPQPQQGKIKAGPQKFAVSGNGEKIVFTQRGSRVNQLYLFDHNIKNIELISKHEDGTEADEKVHEFHISGNGKWVAYTTAANFTSSDSHKGRPLFLYKVDTKTTELITLDQNMETPLGVAKHPSLTHDGSRIAFLTNMRGLPGLPQNKKLKYDTRVTRLVVYDCKTKTYLKMHLKSSR